jgi:hypothetical protein
LKKLRPRWTRALNTLSDVPAGKSTTWEGILNAETHTLLCGTRDPHLLWFGTGLTVGD